MKPTIRIVQLLTLAGLAALGCASTSTTDMDAKTEGIATKATPAKQDVTPPPAFTASLDPVYFEMDRAVLDASARASLEARAKAIQQRPELGVVTIQGHCDERGSAEYNLALGERRAAAVKRYLLDLGVPESRLETVTYGESRPAVVGHDEAAWSRNRRSEFAGDAFQSANR